MAVVYVFTWNHSRNGDGGGWGHASLGIRGGPYISWWPDPNQERKYMVDKKQSPMLARVMQAAIGTTNVYKVQHTSMVSLQEDIVNEGRRPDEKYLIADGVLNTEKIIEWWKGYNYDTASYHVIKKNCSTTVIRALRAGGSDKHLRFGQLSFDCLSKHTGWEPTDITAYLQELNRRLGNEKVRMLDG